jgi:hypothetical protein
MTIQTVPTFMTSDGNMFKTMREAELHELTLELDTQIDIVGVENEIKPRTITMLKRWLPVLINDLGYVKASTAPLFAVATDSPESEQESVA